MESCALNCDSKVKVPNDGYWKNLALLYQQL